jgi:hypothetical protein
MVDLDFLRSMVSKGSQTPPTFLPLTAGGVRNEAASRQAPSLRGIISLHLTSPLQTFTAYHFSNSPPSSRDVTSQNHPLQVPCHDPVSMSHPSNRYGSYLFIHPSITILHVNQIHTSDVFHPALSRSKGPINHLLLATYPLFT